MSLGYPKLSAEERSISYSKYFYTPYPPFPPIQWQCLAKSIDPKDALRPEDMDLMLKPGYFDVEVGYCNMEDGTYYQARYIDMPGVTLDMIDWWFVWHFIGPNRDIVPKEQGNLRYKIWNPNCHWDTGLINEEDMKRYLDETIPMRERKYGVYNYMLETWDISKPYTEDDIPKMTYLKGVAMNPVDFGFNPTLLRTKTAGSIIASTHEGWSKNGDMTIYQFRENDHGVEMRIRDWVGTTVRNGKIIHGGNDEPRSDENFRRSNSHSYAEYQRLAAFLPALYAEEGHKPLNAY